MKIKISKLTMLMLCGFITLFFSCDRKKRTVEIPEQKTEIILPELTKDRVVIAGMTDYYDSVYTFTFESKEVSEKIAFDSLKFKVEFESDGPSIVKIFHGQHRAWPIFSLPGDSIVFDFKLIDYLNERHTQKIFGSRIRENQALAKLNEIMILDNPVYSYQFDVSEEKYLSKMDSLERAGMAIFKAYNKKTKLSPYFKKCYTTYLDYKIREFLVRYESSKRNLEDNQIPTMSQAFDDKLTTYDKEDSTLIDIYPYLTYLNGIYRKNSIDPMSQIANFVAIDSTFTNTEIRNQLKYDLLRRELRMKMYFKRAARRYRPKKKTKGPTIRSSTSQFEFLEEVDDLMQLYRNSNPPENYLENIEEAYDALVN